MKKSQKINNYIIDRFDEMMNKDDRRYIDKESKVVWYQTKNHYIKMMKSVVRGLKDKNLI